jgi:hypothetical protein
MKKFLIVLGIVVSLLVCIAFIKDQILKSVVTVVVSRITGAPVHMDAFSLNILTSTIHISGFKMHNPRGFPEGILMYCPKINVIYDRATLFKQERHFSLVEIELQEMGLAINKEGKLNLESLKKRKKSKTSLPALIHIDSLDLSIGKIVYKDYTISAEPVVRVYDVNSHKNYKSISSQQLQLLIFAIPMEVVEIKKTGIYGAAKLMGVSVLRAAVDATLIGKDNVKEVVEASFEHLYEVSLEVVKRMGTVTKDDAPNGAMKADINGTMVALQLRKSAGNATEITISARQDMFPRLSVAGGVLYQILDKLQLK